MSESAPRPKGRWLLRHLIIDFWMGIPKAVLRSPTAFANGFQWCSARARSTAKELLAGSTFFVFICLFLSCRRGCRPSASKPIFEQP